MEIRKTNVFNKWVNKLKDARAIAKIYTRIDRLANGNPGDVKPNSKRQKLGKGSMEWEK